MNPTRLEWSLEGWPPAGPNGFRWENRTLSYSGDRPPERKFATPSDKEWAALWACFDELDVWSWPSTVGDLMVIDGLMYEIDVEVGSRSIKSNGQCSGSPPGFRDAVIRIHEELQLMVGWVPPKRRPKTHFR